MNKMRELFKKDGKIASMFWAQMTLKQWIIMPSKERKTEKESVNYE